MPPLKYLVVYLSLLVALVLMILPLPDGVQLYRPNWVALALIYWSMALPKRVGLWFAFFTGIILDTSQGTLLGQHAMALTIVAFLTLRFHQRVRLFPIWQQALTVLVLLVLHQLLALWVSRFIGRPPPPWYYWTPSLTSMMLWPLVYVTLRSLRRGFRVS